MELHCLLLQAIKESLFANPFLEQSATTLMIPKDQKIRESPLMTGTSWFFSSRVTFLLIGLTGTKLTLAPSSHPMWIQTLFGSGVVNQVLDCSHRGIHMTYGRKTLDAAKGKHWPGAIGSVTCGCKSAMKVEKYPAHSKIKINRIKYSYEESVTCVWYRYLHNHELSNHTNIGTLLKSKAICTWIKAMVQSGMTISVIMHKLTIEHAALTHLLQSGGEEWPSRDDFITYDDVYYIYYAL